jgi:hypothetical protein
MGLYDGKPNLNLGFGFGFDWKKFKWPVVGVAAAIFVFAVAVLLVLPALQPRVIGVVLEPNPLDLKDGMDTYLTVTIRNVTDATASNVVVSVKTIASDAITIFPATRVIPTLEKNGVRTLSPFAISPNPASPVYSGTYFITISTEINGKSFSEQVALELEAV